MKLRHATIEDDGAARDLLDRCRAVDGRAPLTEFKELRIPVANATRTLVRDAAAGIDVLVIAAWHPQDLGEDVGYWAAEIAADPSVRSVETYGAAYAGLAADMGLRPALWTFDEMQAAAAGQAGLTETRALLEMRRPLPSPSAPLPEGYRARSFVIGDEGLWIALNQRVFAHHPEAGGIDQADLALRMAQPWFDPGGLLILAMEDEPVGYCWTKLHDAATGEIYMIGLVPEHRGRGLAAPLTALGLEHLTERGATTALLYADAVNKVAVRLYRSMGFEIVRRVSLYADTSS